MKQVTVNVGTLAGTWLLGLGVVALIGPSPTSDVIVLIVFVAGALSSVAIKATWAGYVLAAVSCWRFAELCAATVWGHQSVQGRGAHLAVMEAALLGTLVGAAIASGTIPGFLPFKRKTAGR